MQQQSIQFKEATIRYRTSGKGNTVFLLHGFGEDGAVFDNLAEALQEKYRLIIPDLPGSGESEIVNGADIDTYADVVKAIYDIEAGSSKCTIIGHSMGGYIAMAIADKYPGILNGLGLFHSSAYADNKEKKATRTKAIGFIKDKGAYAFLKTSIPGLFNEEYIEINQPHIDALLEKAKTFTAEALIQYYEAMINRPERIEVLKSIKQPVLFIIGEHDKAVPLQSSLAQCHLPATSFVHILKKSGHMGMFEEPGKVLDAIREFLEHV